MLDVLRMCMVSMGKLGYKSVRIRLLGIISIKIKSFRLVAQNKSAYESETLHTVL